ncbi:hypothetical protein ACHQM5_016290 [Ranunculus cassubicifolius]
MANRNVEIHQGDGSSCAFPPPQPPSQSQTPQIDQIRSRAGNTVVKSGPLLLSSKGIGWTVWKKRWFILTRTSLVFFRSDPSVIPQRGSEVNLTLGGIDLNSSGSVVVKEDKKLLTVLFPDGRDGRAFTLKAETSEDLFDWKTALENALAQAPSAALVMGQNGIFRNEPSETVDGGFEQWSDRRPSKSTVIGRPILLALEDVDGTPSFLEKALTFIEQHGVKAEGILRQSADVDDVNRRVREYEEGKNEFTAEEDAHLIGDCVKHVIRALPSSPVPASCCNALLEACRADRGGRINAMRAAIAETFPEPNRRLLQRILQMMQVVASHKSENRMSSSAVSACMAPLLLRPLLAGDCELDNDFKLGGDGSVQLLQAAAAANHAQAIVITLLEEYESIFGDTVQAGSVSPELYSDSEESGSEDDELTDDEENQEDDEDLDLEDNSDEYTEDGGTSSGSESSCTVDDQYMNKISEYSGSEVGSAEGAENCEVNQNTSDKSQNSSSQNKSIESNGNLEKPSSELHTSESREFSEDVPPSTSPAHEETDRRPSTLNKKKSKKHDDSGRGSRRHTLWGRTPAKKNLSMESIEYADEDEEVLIQKLEHSKSDLQRKIANEVKENATLHASLESRKKSLHERRLALEQDVVRLQEQLRKEKEIRETMETRLNKPLERSTISPVIDDKTKAELEDISQAEQDVVGLKKKVADLHLQLNQQSKNSFGPVCGSCGQPQPRSIHPEQAESGSGKTEETKQVDGEIATSNNTKNSTSNQQKNTPSTKVEGGGNVATSSALTKLTTRLNFLKERRTQIVNELQNIENNRVSPPDNPLLGSSGAPPTRMTNRPR